MSKQINVSICEYEDISSKIFNDQVSNSIAQTLNKLAAKIGTK